MSELIVGPDDFKDFCNLNGSMNIDWDHQRRKKVGSNRLKCDRILNLLLASLAETQNFSTSEQNRKFVTKQCCHREGH